MSVVRNPADELLLAEQYDASGDHDSAVNALARATKLGDVEASTQLGKRLIAGDRAPLLPNDGAGLLTDAFTNGGAEAAARLAVLAAAGVYSNHSLDNALQLILIAAERGWVPAQTQLIALTPDRGLASQADQPQVPNDYWRRLAATIKLDEWTASPMRQTLHESPLICTFNDFVSAPVCQWLIDRSYGRLKPALVYDAVGGKDFKSETRTNSWAQFDLMSSEFIHLLVQTRMQAACGLPLYNMEANAILHYAVGEQITEHFDFVSPDIPNYRQEIQTNGQRVLTFLIYLNDDYDNGETEFPKLGIVHKGQRGEGLFFVNALENNEPDLRTVHAGRPPTKGEKWIVSQFVRSRRVLGIAG